MVEFLLLGLVAIVDLVVLVKLIYVFRLLKFPADTAIDVTKLPTVSVCIPARNETRAMTRCLERVVASDYPKLEVIVLDDGSRDNTSILIKSFAHSGVRFVEGKSLPEGWLGKNYAQSLLAKESSGKYLLYIDVDTLIDRHTITRLVAYAIKNSLQMVSVVPLRNDSMQMSNLMATMRHFWTLTRFTPNHPRAASNAWLIEREEMLNQLNIDKTLPQSMLLETSIANSLADQHRYHLVMSRHWLGVRYEKKWTAQLETSIRLLYPQCDVYVLQVVWLIALLIIGLIPYVIVWWQPGAYAFIATQTALAYYYMSHVWLKYPLAGAFWLPVTLIQEIWLMILSVYHYKRGTVTWKGRPITAIPVRLSARR